ncbi:alpha/beta fold hydrolase [Streptomyces sp. NPDC048282]|uniref:alpha/beta fold hydrolase n=1 Tax=Streptomyces sp. NPDC048282 TaxID=3365528 RepID=UPI00371CE61E
MEQFVKDHVDALTTRLDLLDDEGVTAVLRTMMPAHLFDYWGRTLCGPRWARLLHESLPAAELSILEHTGHLAHVERPGRFSASVLAFPRAHSVLGGGRLIPGRSGMVRPCWGAEVVRPPLRPVRA